MTDTPHEWHRNDYTVSTGRIRLDLDRAFALLQTTFWGPTVKRETFHRAAANSICFGLYHGEKLIGFSRVVSDLATYAYWADVVTDSEVRGHGLGQWLCECMLGHPDLQGLRRIGLLTRDAVPLYRRLGFTEELGFLHYMESRLPGEPV